MFVLRRYTEPSARYSAGGYFAKDVFSADVGCECNPLHPWPSTGSRRPGPGRRRRESEAGGSGRQLTKILTAAAEIVEPEKELGRPRLRAAASKTAAARQWFEFCKQRPVLGTDRFAQNARFCVGSLRPTTGGFLKSQLLRDRRGDESNGIAGKRYFEKVLEVNVCISREVHYIC